MLILVAHGSRDHEWRRSLATLAGAVQSDTPGEEVGLAYMQFTGPTLPELVEGAWKNGTRTFRILPLFMASAGHVDKDIRPLVAGLRKRYPEGTIERLPPVGEHPLFHALIPRIVETDRS